MILRFGFSLVFTRFSGKHPLVCPLIIVPRTNFSSRIPRFFREIALGPILAGQVGKIFLTDLHVLPRTLWRERSQEVS